VRFGTSLKNETAPKMLVGVLIFTIFQSLSELTTAPKMVAEIHSIMLAFSHSPGHLLVWPVRH
jgi:hypothetical protein